MKSEFRRTMLAAAAVLAVSSVFAPLGAQAGEFALSPWQWFRPHHHHRAAAHHPRRVVWRESRLEAFPRRACGSLACPGFIILGVGF